MFIEYIRIVIGIAMFMLLAIGSAQPLFAFPHKMLTLESPRENDEGKSSSLQLDLQEVENGLKVSVRFAETKPETKEKMFPELPADLIGGDYLLFLDEMIVGHETYKGNNLNVTREVPLTTLQTGKHVLRCELRSPSGEIHKGEIRFFFEGSPVLNVTDVAVDKAGILDASVLLNILGDDGNGLAGFFQVSLDERLVMHVEITKEHTGGATLLSQVTGKPLSTASLVPGNHLLTLRAIGTSGNATVSYNSFSVTSIPELQIVMDQSNEFQEAVATFQKAPQRYSGIVELFYDQKIILSKQDEDASVSIKRAEIIEGLKSIHYEHNNGPTPLVFALHAANGSENWQKIDFK